MIYLFYISKYFSSWKSRSFYHNYFYSHLSSSLYFSKYCGRSRVFCYQLVDGILLQNIYFSFQVKWSSVKHYFIILQLYFIRRIRDHTNKIKWFWFSIEVSNFLISNCYKNAVVIFNKLNSFINIADESPRVLSRFFPFFSLKTNVIDVCHFCGDQRIDCYCLRKWVRCIQKVCDFFFLHKITHTCSPSESSNTITFDRGLNIYSSTCIRNNYRDSSFCQLFCYNRRLRSSSNYKNF